MNDIFDTGIFTYRTRRAEHSQNLPENIDFEPDTNVYQVFISVVTDKHVLMIMSDQISAAIARVTREEVDINTVKNSKDLISELGLDSIARMKLVLELEKTFGVEIDLDKMDISVFNSVDALEEYVQQHSKAVPENN